MNTKTIRDPRDFWSGVLFIAIGLAAVVLGRRYSFGTASSMGPGFFPSVLGSLLAVLGLIACLRSIRRTKAVVVMGAIRLLPLVVVLASVVLFAVALPKLGLVVASMLLVATSRLAAPGFRWLEVLVFGSLLTVFCAAVFVWGLKMPMSLWPPFLGG